MSWTDFDADTSLERDMLRRALPLAETISTGSAHATVDLAADRVATGVSVSDTAGPTPAKCVDLLGIRPLLTSAAWKVLDLLLEAALDLAGATPDQRRGWSITKKCSHARMGTGRPPAFAAPLWDALMATYVETVDLRHSLVHRRVTTDPSGALVGVTESGAPLRPLTPEEQEALVRTALRAAELVIAPVPDARVEADLTRQLGLLHGLHHVPVRAVTVQESLPEITFIVDADPAVPGHYILDMPRFRIRQPFQGVTHADLIVRLRDRPGQDLHGRLENSPNQVVTVDPLAPPAWLN